MLKGMCTTTSNSAAGLCYISAKVYASMKKEKYRVELCAKSTRESF